MDWDRAIEINREALTRILAGLVAVLATHVPSQAGALRLPLPVYRSTLWMLHKAEGALRRLIVIAARNLAVPLPPRRPMPAGLIIAAATAGGPSRMAFQLFDTRQTFHEQERDAAAEGGPRIRFVDDLSPRAQFLQQFPAPPAGLSTQAQTHMLRLRLAAAERALAHLTREAKRLARWRARRRLMKSPAFTEPMRPGPPPGINRNSKSEIDLVLRECHDLAWHALREDTS